jgi:hypothetical protein
MYAQKVRNFLVYLEVTLKPARVCFGAGEGIFSFFSRRKIIAFLNAFVHVKHMKVFFFFYYFSSMKRKFSSGAFHSVRPTITNKFEATSNMYKGCLISTMGSSK